MVLTQKQLADIANVLRQDVLEMTTSAGSGHATSCLSCAEIMSVLWFDEMSYDLGNSHSLGNDEFVLSKGHVAPILYSALKHAGCMNHDLLKLRKLTSSLEGHPVPSSSMPWVKVATGSLGQGLGVGVGMALSARYNKTGSRVYVLLGDVYVIE